MSCATQQQLSDDGRFLCSAETPEREAARSVPDYSTARSAITVSHSLTHARTPILSKDVIFNLKLSVFVICIRIVL